MVYASVTVGKLHAACTLTLYYSASAHTEGFHGNPGVYLHACKRQLQREHGTYFAEHSLNQHTFTIIGTATAIRATEQQPLQKGSRGHCCASSSCHTSQLVTVPASQLVTNHKHHTEDQCSHVSQVQQHFHHVSLRSCNLWYHFCASASPSTKHRLLCVCLF